MRTISIIIPTFERAHELLKILLSIEKNIYPLKEVIVVDDNSNDNGLTKKIVNTAKQEMKTNIMYLNTFQEGYNLALARNIGVCEAMGDILMFLDDRYELDDNVLQEVAKAQEGIWYYGKKRLKDEIVHKRPFIENFSWITKKSFRKFGIFNERITMYGGMSQDVRGRWNMVGGKEQQVDVYATVIKNTHSSKHKEQIWKMKLLLYKLNH